MRHRPVLHSCEYAAYRAFKTAVLALPHPRVRSFGAGLGALLYRTIPGLRRRVSQNLELGLPDVSELARQRIALGCFRHFFAHFFEILSLSRFDETEILELFDVEGWEVVEQAEQDERGYFLTAGHFGSWEMAAALFQLRVGNLAVVIRPLDNPMMERDLRSIRERFGVRLIPKRGAGHRALNAYRAGARVAVIIDQHPGPLEEGIMVPFLRRPARTSPVLAFLSLHTGAPVIHFRCEPIAGGRYRVTVRPPIEPRGSGRDSAAQLDLTRRYLEEVEHDIESRPELWLWMHRRWRNGVAA